MQGRCSSLLPPTRSEGYQGETEDLAVAARVEMPHVVAVDYVIVPDFAAAITRCGKAPGLIQQRDWARGREIEISGDSMFA